MKLAFISANRENLPDPVIPLGILYVMAAVEDAHDCELWDLCFEEEPVAALASRLEHSAPDIVALGLRNIQSGDYTGHRTNLEYYTRLIEVIRQKTSAPIVLGGAGFSVMPHEIMRHLGADYGISGEAEAAFPKLLEVLAGDRDDAVEALERIDHLHYRAGEELRSVRHPTPYLELDTLRRPRRELVDPRYYTTSGIDSVQTKRGCPLRCDYCTYPLIEGRSIRHREPARVVDEILETLDRQPAMNHFFIVDSVFNLPPSHAKDVCREMIRRHLDTPWTCYANPIGFDRELVELMAEARCAGLEIGSDSGVDTVLTRLRKGFDTRRVREMHRDCEATGVPDCHTFILGTQGETIDDVNATLDFCIELDPFAAIFMIWTDDTEALDERLAVQRRVFRREISALMESRATEFPRWVIPPLGVNFDRRLFDVLRRRGLTGPLWQHLRRLRPGRPGASAAPPSDS